MLINDYEKAYWDRYMPRPRGGFSSANMRNQFLALASGDYLPLRPQVSVILEQFDYAADTSAQLDWSGTGVTIATNKTDQNYGLACLQLTIDVTGNRTCTHGDFTAIDLSDCALLGLWHRADLTVATCKFVIRDGSGNESYWNLTTHVTPDTWAQLAITLASPDGNNGTPAILTDIVAWEFQDLEASTVYLFDNLYAHIAQKKIYINPASIGSYFMQTSPQITHAGGLSGEFAVPSDDRIDLVSMKIDGTITITQGADKVAPDDDDIPATPAGGCPICAVYCKSTMVKIVEYHYKDADTDEGYIYKDLRPFFHSGVEKALQAATGDGTTTIDWTLGNYFTFTFGAQNDIFTFTPPVNPGKITLMLIQDGSGSRLATWPGTVKWPAGTAPTLTTAIAAIDICEFYWDGTNYFGTSHLAFA